MPVTQALPDGPFEVDQGTPAPDSQALTVFLQQKGNMTDAEVRNRSNHTGTQAISTVDGLQANLDSRVASTAIDNIVVMTQAAYDALGTKDSRTLYAIEG